jgi:hypothetical protein
MRDAIDGVPAKKNIQQKLATLLFQEAMTRATL